MARNHAVFNRAVFHPSHTFNKFVVDYACTINMAQAVKQDKTVAVQSDAVWKPPSQGRYKLNTDASWKDKRAAGGGVVRPDDGSWVAAFAVKLRAGDPQEAELMALRFGLLFMETLDIKEFEVEVDAVAIKNLIQSEEDLSRHKLAPILKDVADCFAKSEGITLHHISRSINKVAHGLAEYGMRMKKRKWFFDLPPTFLNDEYENDLKKTPPGNEEVPTN